MTQQASARERSCPACGGTCRRPPAGSSWVMVWRIGSGPECEMVTQTEEPECQAVARVPNSALPHSYQQLLVEDPSGGRSWWLTVDARRLASARLDLLKVAALLVRGVLVLATPRGDTAFEKLRRFARAEMQKARQPDPLLERCRSIARLAERGRGEAGPSLSGDAEAGLYALLQAVVDEATRLGQAWRSHDAVLSDDFFRMAGELSVSSRLKDRVVPPQPTETSLVRHHVVIPTAAGGTGPSDTNFAGWFREYRARGGAL